MKWKFVTKKASELRTQEKNPRKLSKKQKEDLQKSLDSFGCAQPIVITNKGEIIGGHQRFSLLRGKGVVDCMECQEDLTEMQIDELTIRLNKNSGSFDFDALANGYNPEDLVNWGFSMQELDLEALPESVEKPKSYQLTAKFENEDDLSDAERQIAEIIKGYQEASYKVKVK